MRVVVACVATAVVFTACGSGGDGKRAQPSTTTSSTLPSSSAASAATTFPPPSTPSHSVPATSVPAAPAGTVRVTDSQNGSTVSVKRGQRLVISLRDPADGGYTYQVAQQADPEIIYYEGTHKEPPPAGSPPGASGTDVYQYRADRAGTARLRLDAVRPGTGERGNSFSLTVNVTP